MECDLLLPRPHAGILLRWTKDFDAKGAMGKDVVQLLQQAFTRRGVSEHVTVITLCRTRVCILCVHVCVCILCMHVRVCALCMHVCVCVLCMHVRVCVLKCAYHM